MSYTPTVWVDGSVPDIDATNLNHLENGVQATAVVADAAIPNPGTKATNNGLVYNGSDWVAQTIKDAQIDAAAAIAVSKLAGYPADATKFLSGNGSWTAPGGTPTGSVVQYGAATSPSGWVLCDGASYLRADGTHDALFAIIGTLYGTVDGTHFNVPDFRGRVPVGFAASGGHADVATLGNSDGVAVANRRAKHRHTPHTHTGNVVPSAPLTGAAGSAENTIGSFGVIGSSDGGSGNANDSLDAPAYVVVNYIIKL